MALVRFGNKPDDVRDLGPARGRLNVSGFIAMGGPLTADSSRAAKNAQHQRAYVERRAVDPNRCGRHMPKGGICIERQGHLSHCRTAKK